MSKTIMYKNIIYLIFGFQFTISKGQIAPQHLKYFGFVAIDCLYDDPLDTTMVTNYISEVDSFSNIAHMCVYDYTDNIVSRTNLMNSHCVNPILHMQNVFFQAVDTLAPSGLNYDLYPDFNARWTAFKSANLSVLAPDKIGCFYIIDEPYWNGVSLPEMDAVCSLLKNDFPTIPLLMIEAYTTVNIMQVPIAMDWVGFDMYGIFDPQFDPQFIQNLDTLKAKLSSPNQKIMLIIDDQWYPEYQTYLGWTQDTMASVVQNYYDLAVSDTNIIGLLGYTWPGGLDATTHHGVRNLTANVINKNIEIGKLIKVNYSPCSITGVETFSENILNINMYPNPAADYLNLEFIFTSKNIQINIYNSLGQIINNIQYLNEKNIQIETKDLKNGLYFIEIHSTNMNFINKFIINK